MANHDQVSDTRRGRIEYEGYPDLLCWLSARVTGKRVLDMGCGEGAIPLNLGREGHEVIGLDIDELRLAAARKALSAESASVQARVKFRQGDAFTVHFPSSSFDSIIIGEAIEYTAAPDKLLATACECLVDNGLLVVSVSLGFHPDCDRKRIFYLLELIELLSQRFSVLDVDVLHERHLCAVAAKPPLGRQPEYPSREKIHAWSLMCSRALDNIQQRAYHTDLGGRVARLKLEKARERLGQVEESLRTETKARKKLERRVCQLQDQCADAFRELAVRMGEVRYRLGDALVLAASPSKHTLLLPFRFLSLLVEGLKKRRRRRQLGLDVAGEASSTPRFPADVSQRPAPRPLPGWLLPLESSPRLEEAFSLAPPELVARKNLRIAAVMDEFSWRAWQYEADVFTFRPDNWQKAMGAGQPDLLLVESTWHGVDDSWHFQVRDLGRRPDKIARYALPEIVQWCRQRGIPTVFYNKEDPPNFEFFIGAAKLFDFVFTSDAGCVDEYRRQAGHDRVFALPFAAQPRVHNPILSADRRGEVCFAGTWFNHRHLDRQSGAEAVLKPAIEHDLHIFDRMADSGGDDYRWPNAYQACVYGALPYAQMVEAYKRFKVFLNINSVTDSPTMFARRVFELLASGTPVLSSPSRGIEEILGGDLVLIGHDEETSRQHLHRLLSDDAYRERLSLRGQRKVFSSHTYAHRLASILKIIGLDAPTVRRPAITFLAAVESEAEVEAAWRQFVRQDYCRARLTLCLGGPELASYARRVTDEREELRLIVRQGDGWGGVMAQAMSECHDGWVAAMRPGDYYGPHYLTDYANVTLYLEHPAMGKGRYCTATGDETAAMPAAGEDYRFVRRTVEPGTLCLTVKEARGIARSLMECASADAWWQRAAEMYDRVYSSDPFNYVRREEAAGGPSGAETSDVEGDPQHERLAAALV